LIDRSILAKSLKRLLQFTSTGTISEYSSIIEEMFENLLPKEGDMDILFILKKRVGQKLGIYM